MKMDKIKSILAAVLIGIAVIIIGIKGKKTKEPTTPIKEELNNEFNLNIIKLVNGEIEDNYLISPYSIETAFSMLREGANNKSKDEIDSAIKERNINVFDVKERINIANGVFIKEEYKSTVKESFTSSLKNKYKAEILYDEFITPDKLNTWVKEKTFNMIEKVKDSMDPNFVLGLVNTVALDVEWEKTFECDQTTSEKFTLANNKTKNVEMMHNTISDTKYYKSDNEEGIVLNYVPYNSNGDIDYDGTKLEFIAIKPTKEDLKTYINNFTEESFISLIENPIELKNDEEIKLSLPRFEYDYEYEQIKEDIKKLGIKQVFDIELADLSKITDKVDLYVDEVIHKTHIELNEKGTKAAAVTYVGINTRGMFVEKKAIDIRFDSPFLYIIRDSKTKEMLFFGTVYNPNEWKGTTCEGEE